MEDNRMTIRCLVRRIGVKHIRTDEARSGYERKWQRECQMMARQREFKLITKQ